MNKQDVLNTGILFNTTDDSQSSTQNDFINIEQFFNSNPEIQDDTEYTERWLENLHFHGSLEEFLFHFVITAKLLQVLLVNDVPLWLILNLRRSQIQPLDDDYIIVYNDVIFELSDLDNDVREKIESIFDYPDDNDLLLFEAGFWNKIMRLAFPDSNILVLGTGS